MTRRIERKCWAESLCVEPSGQKCCAEGSTPFPNLGFFYGKRLFFIIEEATQTSILCRETLAPEAAPPMVVLAKVGAFFGPRMSLFLKVRTLLKGGYSGSLAQE